MQTNESITKVVTCLVDCIFSECKAALLPDAHLFWGPSPTRYSMTRSTVPRSLGRTGLANGGPGGCMPGEDQVTDTPISNILTNLYVYT